MYATIAHHGPKPPRTPDLAIEPVVAVERATVKETEAAMVAVARMPERKQRISRAFSESTHVAMKQPQTIVPGATLFWGRAFKFQKAQPAFQGGLL